MTEIKPQNARLLSVDKLTADVSRVLNSEVWTETKRGVSATEMVDIYRAICRLGDRVDELRAKLQESRSVGYERELREK